MFSSQDGADDKKTTFDNIDFGGAGGHVTKSKCMIVFIADTGRIFSGESMQCRNYLAHRFFFSYQANSISAASKAPYEFPFSKMIRAKHLGHS